MKISFFAVIFLGNCFLGITQQIISGHVFDHKGEPIVGANAYIEGSYDGNFTDENGFFSFQTSLQGTQTLVVRFLGFEDVKTTLAVSRMQHLSFRLKQAINTFEAVEIISSTFSAGDQSKSAVLKPLDIVTTAGALGDVNGAIKTLPGTQANAEDGRLFVRGGDASETAIFVDGMRVFTPYTRGLPGIPVRGRFSPFLFKGVQFSTGGYGVGFGQALSGMLDMQTIDEVEGDETNISVMSLGAGLGFTKKWAKSSLSLNSSYINFKAYTWLEEGRSTFSEPFEGISGELVYRKKVKNGLWKTYFSADHGSMGVYEKNLLTEEDNEIHIINKNYYLNSTYNTYLNDKTSLFTGISAGLNDDHFSLSDEQIQTDLIGFQYRLALKTAFTEWLTIEYGIEHLFENHSLDVRSNTYTVDTEYDLNISSAFIQSQYYFSPKFAVKAGLRMEYIYYTQLNYLPRLSLAHKMGEKAQVSLSYGVFSQNPLPQYMQAQNNLQNEKSQHFILSYNRKTPKSHFQLEGYYKKYENLVRFPSNDKLFLATNTGDGYAYGMDFFWRLNNWIENYDCWLSYGLLYTERHFRNFPQASVLPFATRHNLSFVNKVWFSKLTSQLSFTYQFASGRPYHNPNHPGFMQAESKPFHIVDIGWAYLISQQQILYLSVSNAPNIHNEMGRRFAAEPNAMGYYPSEAISPNFNQFFFVGFFWTIGHDRQKNMLDQL